MTDPLHASPLLVVEGIERQQVDPARFAILLRLGGYPMRFVIEFSHSPDGMVEYLEAPPLLNLHYPSARAIVKLTRKVLEGHSVNLPVDLSDEVRSTDPPFPFVPSTAEELAELEAKTRSVQIDEVELEQQGSEPTLFSGHLRVNGTLIKLVAELYAGPGRATVLRWLHGSDRKRLSELESAAVQLELKRRCST